MKYEDALQEHEAGCRLFSHSDLVRNSASRFLQLDFLLNKLIRPHFKQAPMWLCGAWSNDVNQNIFQKYENGISQKEIFVLHFLSLHDLYQFDLFVFCFCLFWSFLTCSIELMPVLKVVFPFPSFVLRLQVLSFLSLKEPEIVLFLLFQDAKVSFYDSRGIELSWFQFATFLSLRCTIGLFFFY